MGKKRIGILTLYLDNFNMGGLLQAYALQKTLDNLGYDAKQICFDFKKNYAAGNSLKSKIKNTGLGRMIVRCRMWKRQNGFLHRNINFYKFMNQVQHSKEVYHGVKEFENQYDVLLVGSDQVWGEFLETELLKCYLLEGAGNPNKYTYAASFGSDQIKEEWKPYFAELLPAFKQVSVRENNAKKELFGLLPNMEVRVDLDPTLLLTANEWTALCNNTYRKDKYIFCYFLGNEPRYREETKKIAEKYNLPIVTLPYIFDNDKGQGYDENFGEYRDYESGPAEFVSAIRDAEVIITDSFHAAVFSTQFHKKFYVLSRVNEYAPRTDTRMLDFLNEFDLRERFISVKQLNGVQLLKPIDCAAFEEKIPHLRKESLAYLKQID